MRSKSGMSQMRERLREGNLPDFVEPTKAKLVDSMRPGDWIYEIRFDGYRALALRGGRETRVLSRNEKDLGSKFTEVADSIAALNVQDALIDRDIVTFLNGAMA
jgi:bifunctional non-homologous end joining protein LigD